MFLGWTKMVKIEMNIIQIGIDRHEPRANAQVILRENQLFFVRPNKIFYANVTFAMIGFLTYQNITMKYTISLVKN